MVFNQKINISKFGCNDLLLRLGDITLYTPNTLTRFSNKIKSRAGNVARDHCEFIHIHFWALFTSLYRIQRNGGVHNLS